MNLARACWLTLCVGCASQPSPGDVLKGLMTDASECSDVSTHLGDSQTAQREAQPIVDCMNAALAAKTAAYTSTVSDSRGGCRDLWWFVTDNGRVRLFDRLYHGDLCEGGDVSEDPGCDGPFVVDDTPFAFWAIQATGCMVVAPTD
jgi:hypothetical protein